MYYWSWGSIGSQLCSEILKLEPRNIVLIERNEHSLYTLLNKINEINSKNIEVIPILCCMTNQRIFENIFINNKVDVIFHCAAYKHVPLVEVNPINGIYNNVFSTINLCNIASKFKLKKVILISSDKAVRPTNIMGASKDCVNLFFNLILIIKN